MTTGYVRLDGQEREGSVLESSRNLVKAPEVEPITVEDAMGHMRVHGDREWQYVDDLVQVARESVEATAWRALITQTWDVFYPCWPSGALILPLAPLQEVEEVVYRSRDGQEEAWDASEYTVSAGKDPATLRPAHGSSWPNVGEYDDAVRVRIVVGYGDEASDVPARYRHAVRLLVSHLYEAREPVVVGSIVTEIPMTISSLILQDSARRFR